MRLSNRDVKAAEVKRQGRTMIVPPHVPRSDPGVFIPHEETPAASKTGAFPMSAKANCRPFDL